MAVDFELELVWIPVSDVDRAKRFYLEQAGFDLLVDIPNGLPGHRIVQVTPPGSACSIGFGAGVTAARPGSQQGLFMVADIFAARDELAARGVQVGEVRHIADGAWVPGPHPGRADYMSFAEFSDPTATAGCCKNVAASPVHPIADRSPPSQAIELT
jgi:catechol 2,3-dioxygenase-like lactoylglutathione lyase family enzyme